MDSLQLNFFYQREWNAIIVYSVALVIHSEDLTCLRQVRMYTFVYVNFYSGICNILQMYSSCPLPWDKTFTGISCVSVDLFGSEQWVSINLFRLGPKCCCLLSLILSVLQIIINKIAWNKFYHRKSRSTFTFCAYGYIASLGLLRK